MPGIHFPGSTKAAGDCLGVPDVCKVPAPPAPPVPMPFPNQGMCANADKTIDKVLFENKEVVVELSEIPSSTGDEAGTAGGVVSGTNAGPVTFKLGSSKVFAKGKKVAYATGVTAHNGKNANMPVGAQVGPSQSKVLVSP
jgi:hypothetical protein